MVSYYLTNEASIDEILYLCFGCEINNSLSLSPGGGGGGNKQVTTSRVRRIALLLGRISAYTFAMYHEFNVFIHLLLSIQLM